MPWADSKTVWDEFIAMLSPSPGMKILDLGAGEGEVASRVLQAAQGADLYAVDPDEKRVSTMKRDSPEVKAFVAEAEGLSFPDSNFDSVYTTMALHHYSDFDKAIGEIARVLKSGGAFVVLEMEPRSGLGRMFRFFGKITGEHMNMLSEEQLETRLNASGIFRVKRSVALGSRYIVLATRM